MPFSDTVNKKGLIQECEFFTNLGDGTISGDISVYLPQFTTRINRSFDRIMPRVLSHDTNQRWDDINHPTHPIGTADIVSGQNDYTFLADSAGNSVLNITKILAMGSGQTQYGIELYPVISGQNVDVPGVTSGRIGTIDSAEDTRVLSPFTTDVGTPIKYIERGNTFFVWPIPNYSAVNGFKIFFERTPSYFVSTDTTKTPGIPYIFHQLLALYSSQDWLYIHKPGAQALLQYIATQIKEQEDNLDTMIGKRNPNSAGIRAQQDNTR